VSQSISGFTASGLVNNEAASVLAGVSAGGSGTNAGSYATTASGIDGNYNLTFVDGNLTIGKANATVTANSDASKTYSGVSQSASGFTASGLVNNEAASVLAGVTAGGAGTNAGSYATTASGIDGNYNLTFVNGALTIGKAHLTVTADNQTRLYGAANPTLTETITGFVNGENASVVTGTATGTTTATASTAVGTAAIVASTAGLSAGNYDFAASTVNAVLTISPAPTPVPVPVPTSGIPAVVAQAIADLPGGDKPNLVAAYTTAITESSYGAESNDLVKFQRRGKALTGTAFQEASPLLVMNGGIKLPADMITAGSGEPKPAQQ
jgi:hypothetical protein